jgi:uncharacterized protein YaiI (UPF0178 family)
MPDIYIDGDACPVKDEALRVAARYGLETYMVSHQGLRASVGQNIHAILVGPEFDAADNWIAEHIGPGDIAITSDIPLADRCLKKGACALGPTGRAFTESSIGSALALRDLNAYLREAGEINGRNAPFSRQDRSRFLQALDALIQKLKAQAASASAITPRKISP